MIDSEATVAPNNSHSGYPGWILRVISVVACVAVATVVASLTLGPPFARAWAQWVARHVGGDFETGVVLGFVTGLLGIAVTLFAALVSSLAWRRRGGPALSLGIGACFACRYSRRSEFEYRGRCSRIRGKGGGEDPGRRRAGVSWGMGSRISGGTVAVYGRGAAVREEPSFGIRACQAGGGAARGDRLHRRWPTCFCASGLHIGRDSGTRR